MLLVLLAFGRPREEVTAEVWPPESMDRTFIASVGESRRVPPKLDEPAKTVGTFCEGEGEGEGEELIIRFMLWGIRR